MLQGGYPAKLKKVLIVTAPLWFKAPFKILRLFVREKLRDRVFTVSIPQVSMYTVGERTFFSAGVTHLKIFTADSVASSSCLSLQLFLLSDIDKSTHLPAPIVHCPRSAILQAVCFVDHVPLFHDCP
jgi:hypothetical protein